MNDTQARSSECTQFELAGPRSALAATGWFTPGEIKAAYLTRLKGLTNRVYKVDTPTASYCLRIPGVGTAAIIDRRAEEANARSAAAAGIAPEVLHFGADGVMLTPFIGDAQILSARRFQDDSGAVVRVGLALRRLHENAGDFASDFDVFRITRSYVDLLRCRGAEIPPAVPDLMREAEQVRLALAAHPAALRPCHCDATGANLLDTGQRIWLVDWEYSGMNDPMWDLAYLSIQASFDPALDQALLAAYLGRPATAPEASRMAVHLALVELLSALWALIQHASGNQAADFRAYANLTLERCRDRMRAAEFRNHLETVRRASA